MAAGRDDRRTVARPAKGSSQDETVADVSRPDAVAVEEDAGDWLTDWEGEEELWDSSQTQQRRERANSRPAEGRESRVKQLDLNTLLASPLEPPKYLVDGLLAEEDITNLTARWSVGKTWFAMDLALAIADATREEFLGRTVAHGPVCYFDEESTLAIVRERLKKLGAEPGKLDDLHFYLNSGLRLDAKSDVDRMWREVQAIRPALVVFDSLTRFHNRDENSSGDMARLFDLGIKPLSRALGAAVLLLDHPAKESQGRMSDPGQAARGSGDKLAQVDRAWVLERTSDPDCYLLRHGKVRRGRVPDDFLVARCSEERADGERVWHRQGSLEEVAYYRDRRAVEELCRYLREQGRHVSRQEINENLFGGKASKAQRVINIAMRTMGLQEEEDVKDRRRRWYWLPEASPQDEAA